MSENNETPNTPTPERDMSRVAPKKPVKPAKAEKPK